MLIDISNHQGAINWAVTAPAVDGAYIKITEGTGYIDPYWSGYHAGLTGGGKPCGAYHFADLTDPVAEANFFADQYLQATWQLRPVLDIESYGATAGWIVAFRDQFRRRVSDPRFRVYTAMGFLQYALDPAGWIDADTDIWMAHYSTTPGWDHPALVLWQNSSGANIPGVVGNVDIDQYMNGWTPAADSTTGGFLMSLPDWQQSRIFDRILSMSEGVDGQNFDGPQFKREQDWRNATDATLAGIVAQLTAVQGALTQEEANLLAAIKAVPTPTVDPAVLTKALTDAGLPKAVVSALLAVLTKAAATP